jgi:hypothetical protein
MCLCFWVLLAMFLAMLISLLVACFFKLLQTSLQYKVSFLRTVLPDHSTGVIKGTLSKDGRIRSAKLEEEVRAEVLGAVLYLVHYTGPDNAETEIIIKSFSLSKTNIYNFQTS